MNGENVDHTQKTMPSDEIRRAADRLRRHAEFQTGIQEQAKRLQEADDRAGYFISLAKCKVSVEEGKEGIAIDSNTTPLISIERTRNHPDLALLTGALTPKSRQSFAILHHISTHVCHELYVSQELAHSPQAALNIAYRIVSLLRMRSNCLFNAVAFSEIPWSQMACHDESVSVQILEELRSSLWPADGVIEQQDLNWCVDHIIRLIELYEVPNYRLAFDAAAESPFIRDARTSVARMWSGIEALFGAEHELSFRLSLYAAVLISDDPDERVRVKSRFKRLYGLRSKAVHGAKMTDAALQEALTDSWDLLRDLLIACIQTAPTVPSVADLDRALLGYKLSRDGGVSATP
ncbi:hypothetical protein I6J42_07860 [Streptomyces californicus]|uniref:Apea-like HEPN domain-containing protein n=1 Tax=Streptomyces californicus TaxID=67351 RepID=A0ABD7D033_9ACTN|nr:HEPN domain-containing protein [Streptomyces californicus]QRV33991.1 hypothetical protein I6J42_07860 [Streptomyces californicus]QRV50503.1 hypothetical protein I6J43_25780 [Streptomyces californicus]